MLRLEVVIPLFITITSSTLVYTHNGEKRLLNDLFKNYTVEVRPVLNDSDAVVVSIGLEINQLINLEEKSESITTFMFVRQYWNDPSLKWNPQDYNNITTINVLPHRIWRPDIVLENNVEKDYSFGGSLDTLKNRVILNSNGDVKWLTPALLFSKCPMNIQYFPFDTQKCELVFLSWTHSGKQIDLKIAPTGFSLNSYTNHSEWYLESVSVSREETFYSCCPGTPYPVVHFKLVLKRRPLFYLLNLILPIVVISMLTMLIFFLPAESGERISFGVTIFLSMTVFMLIVNDLIPATSDSVPLVTIFFTSIMIEMVAMMITLCYILNLYLKTPEDEPLPKWMRFYVYDNLAFKLGLRKKQKKFIVSPSTNNGMELNVFDEKIIPSSNEYFNGNHAAVLNRNIHRGKSERTHVSLQKGEKPSNTYSLNQKFHEKFDWLITRFEREDEEKEQMNEWRICALTFDRLSFIIFTCIFLSTTLGCFLQAP